MLLASIGTATPAHVVTQGSFRILPLFYDEKRERGAEWGGGGGGGKTTKTREESGQWGGEKNQ